MVIFRNVSLPEGGIMWYSIKTYVMGNSTYNLYQGNSDFLIRFTALMSCAHRILVVV